MFLGELGVEGEVVVVGQREGDKEVRIHGPTAKSSGVNERGNAALIVMDSHNCYD